MDAEKQIVITGAQSVGSASHPRLEIFDLIQVDKYAKQWSLYVQAIAALQSDSPDDGLSWYQMASIHGLPTEQTWNGGPKKPFYGYCHHGLFTFPTWHRPYMALYEQALHQKAVKIAQGYKTDPDAWNTAADTLRMPYWDWSVHITPPEVLYDGTKFPKIKIVTANGPTDFPNPFLVYTFQKPLAPPYNTPTTIRHPNLMIPELKKGGVGLNDKVWRMLFFNETWTLFSNFLENKDRKADSVEGLHNGMHNRIGAGGGHMSNPRIAAFDAFFWLHHANVDRLTALWQKVHPDAWISEAEGLNTDLSPFWNAPGEKTFHRSSSTPVREYDNFYYTYPELQVTSRAPAADARQALIRKIAQIYGAPNGPQSGRGGPGKKEWQARVRSKAYALSGSYTIFIFLGKPADSPNPTEWYDDPAFVDVSEIFANPHPGTCTTCSANIDASHETFVDLTSVLVDKGYSPNSVEEVKAYIKDNLQWRVRKVDNTVVPNDDLKGVNIAVESFEITFSKEGDVYLPLSTNVEQQLDLRY